MNVQVRSLHRLFSVRVHDCFCFSPLIENHANDRDDSAQEAEMKAACERMKQKAASKERGTYILILLKVGPLSAESAVTNGE